MVVSSGKHQQGICNGYGRIIFRAGSINRVAEVNGQKTLFAAGILSRILQGELVAAFSVLTTFSAFFVQSGKVEKLVHRFQGFRKISTTRQVNGKRKLINVKIARIFLLRFSIPVN